MVLPINYIHLVNLNPIKTNKFDIKEEIENVVTKMLKWNFIVLLENKLAGGNIKPKKIKGRKNSWAKS